MSNENQFQEGMGDGQEGQMPTRLQALKQKATLMGISFSNNIGEEALAKKIEDKLAGNAPVAQTSELNPLDGDVAGSKPKAKMTLRQRQIAEQMALTRVRITCMNPQKKDLHGQEALGNMIPAFTGFTIGDEVTHVTNVLVGHVRKFIPYGEASEGGYHIPKCLLTMLQEKKFLQITTVRDKRTGTTRPVTKEVREFAIEILPPLTQEELRELATAQIAAGSIDG